MRFADLAKVQPLTDVVRHRVERHPNQIVRVELHDDDGLASNPYLLREGVNPFRSFAVFSDGTSEPYPCHWRCFPRGSHDGTAVFGAQRRESVDVHRAPNHEQYLELSCWAKDPQTGDRDIPFSGVAFKYTSSDG